MPNKLAEFLSKNNLSFTEEVKATKLNNLVMITFSSHQKELLTSCFAITGTELKHSKTFFESSVALSEMKEVIDFCLNLEKEFNNES